MTPTRQGRVQLRDSFPQEQTVSKAGSVIPHPVRQSPLTGFFRILRRYPPLPLDEPHVFTKLFVPGTAGNAARALTGRCLLHPMQPPSVRPPPLPNPPLLQASYRSHSHITYPTAGRCCSDRGDAQPVPQDQTAGPGIRRFPSGVTVGGTRRQGVVAAVLEGCPTPRVGLRVP